jgi:predicted nucleotidyltransferase component of viral defense system
LLSEKPTLEQLLEVQQHFELPSPELVEKDWHVVNALAAILKADTKPFRLVFGGGTALGRAYGLIKRMSEDIDLRIVGVKNPTKGQLRKLRHAITKALQDAGYKLDPQNQQHITTMRKGRYSVYHVPYERITEGGKLRPEIKIETSVFPLRRDAVKRPVSSFVAEAYSKPAEIPEIDCVSVPETAADKLVALTRRAGAHLAGIDAERDTTLVRHVHDIHATRTEYDVSRVAKIVDEIMPNEAAERAENYPAYRADPLAETLNTIDGIAASPDFAADHADFRRDMVYGGDIDFQTAMATVKELGRHLRKAQDQAG